MTKCIILLKEYNSKCKQMSHDINSVIGAYFISTRQHMHV